MGERGKKVLVDRDGVPTWETVNALVHGGRKNNHNENYESLARILDAALDQASVGKGRERHANGEPFEDQLIMQIARMTAGHPEAFQVGQAIKKAVEAGRLSKEAAAKEYAGAINYLAAASLRAEERS